MANLPWRIEPHDGYVCEDDTVPPMQIVDASGDVVADNVQFYPRAITADRAELIVRAVNSYDELLSALKHLIREARGTSDIFLEAKHRAHKAIKKAEGRL